MLFMAHVDDCQLFDLRSVFDHRGTIAIVEAGQDIGFEIQRMYWTFDIPSRATRAGHAHRALRQLYVAVSGSFDVHLYDGRNQRVVHLSRPDQGLTLGPGIWRELTRFSSNACLLVAASAHYDEADYIRELPDFQRLVDSGELA
jgi:dTDP-4-dehydrorhamnose 3,5-epimerase-like enzyme